MAKITYHGDSEQVSWFGVVFENGKAVETEKRELIEAAEKNPLFDVKGGDAEAQKRANKAG